MTQPNPPTGLNDVTWEDGLMAVLKAEPIDRNRFYDHPWISLVDSRVIGVEDDVPPPGQNEFFAAHLINDAPNSGDLRYLLLRARVDWYVPYSTHAPHEYFWNEFWNHSRDILAAPPTPLPLDPESFHRVAESMYNLAMWLDDARAQLRTEIDDLDSGKSGFAGSAAQAYRESLVDLEQEMRLLRNDLESNKNWPEMLHKNGDAATAFSREVRRAWSEWSSTAINQPSEMIRRMLDQMAAQLATSLPDRPLELDFGGGTRLYRFTDPGVIATLDRDLHDYFLERVTLLDQEMRTHFGNLRDSFDETSANLLDPLAAPLPSPGGNGGGPNINGLNTGGLGGGGSNTNGLNTGGLGGLGTGGLGGGGSNTDGLNTGDLGGLGTGGLGGGGSNTDGLNTGDLGGLGTGGLGTGGLGGLGGGLDGSELPGSSFDGGLPGTGAGGSDLGGLGGSAGGPGVIPGGGLVGGPGLGGLPSLGGGRPTTGRDEPGVGSGGIGGGNGDFQEGPSALDPDDLPSGIDTGSGGSLPGLGGSSGSGIGGSLPGLDGGSSGAGGLAGIPGDGAGGDFFGGAAGSDGTSDGWLGTGWKPGSGVAPPTGGVQIGPLGTGGGGLGLAGLATAAAAGAAGGALASGAAGMSGMGAPMMPPMMPPMGGMGAGGQQEKDRERKTWLTEEEEVWGTDPDVGPSVIGRDETLEDAGVELTQPSVSQKPVSPYRPARGNGQQSYS
ncbi:WXG100 family type VII secretion target [Micromonospora sp. NPDC050417]|uniref:WXG100 family type VII secretion target n=1 Tax=Micromonospora sp. NPDC050417 TaxID=3364280 RepID=UPI0037A386AD